MLVVHMILSYASHHTDMTTYIAVAYINVIVILKDMGIVYKCVRFSGKGYNCFDRHTFMF